MFTIANQTGVTLPQLFAPKAEPADTDGISLAGSKTQQVQTFNSNRNVTLPHISQRSNRPAPKMAHQVAVNTNQSSMLEALEIYKKSCLTHSPDIKEVRSTIFQTVPCPTPIEECQTITPPPNPMQINVQKYIGPKKIVRKSSVEKILNVVQQPTYSKQLPVSTTLQRRLEKLAKHKSIATKKQQQSVKLSIRADVDPKMSVKNGNISLPVLKGERTTNHMHYSFKSTLLPKIKDNPRKAALSYQLLEIPVKVTKPERRRIMFSHTHYDAYQHTKFDPPISKKLSIVGGPESKLDTSIWDYNKFLYLNVKI